jgi:hypothetical protein
MKIPVRGVSAEACTLLTGVISVFQTECKGLIVLGMSIREQFHNQLWAISRDYDEVLPYLNDERYDVCNTYHANGLFDYYWIGLK